MTAKPNVDDIKTVADIAQQFTESLKDPPPKTEESKPADGGKPATPIIPSGGISEKDLELFKGEEEKPKQEVDVEKIQAEVDKKVVVALSETPFKDLDALIKGGKDAQRYIQQLKDELKEQKPEVQKALIRDELEKYLGKQKVDDEQISQLKELEDTDPDAAKMLKLEFATDKRMKGIESALENIQKLVTDRAEIAQVEVIKKEFQKAAEDSGISYHFLLAFGTNPPYDKMTMDKVVRAAKPEWEEEVKKIKAGLIPAPKKEVPAGPDTTGTSGTISKPLTADDLGVPGDRKFNEVTQAKMLQLAKEKLGL